MSELQLVDHYARVYIQTALNQGYDLKTVFEQSGLADKTLVHDSFDFADLVKLSRHVKLLLQDEFCGLTKSGCRVGAIELMVDLAASGTTLKDALEKAFRFYAVLSDGIRFTLLELDEATAAVQVDIANPELDQYHFLSEWWLQVIWGTAGWLIGERIEPLSFVFPHPPQIPEAEYSRALGCECLFSQSCARIVFKRDYLDKPVLKAGSQTGEFISGPYHFGELPSATTSITTRLRAFLKARFTEDRNFPAMDEAAGYCHLTTATLRRKLLEEGTSFTQIKDNIRRDIALKLLRVRNIAIDAITAEAGFCDTSSLSRAVKNWTGMYPKQYRHSLGL